MRFNQLCPNLLETTSSMLGSDTCVKCITMTHTLQTRWTRQDVFQTIRRTLKAVSSTHGAEVDLLHQGVEGVAVHVVRHHQQRLVDVLHAPQRLQQDLHVVWPVVSLAGEATRGWVVNRGENYLQKKVSSSKISAKLIQIYFSFNKNTL